MQKTSPEIRASVPRTSGGGRRALIGHPRQRIYDTAAPGFSLRRNTQREPDHSHVGAEKRTSAAAEVKGGLLRALC